MNSTRFGLVSVLGSLTAIALFSSCAPDASFVAGQNSAQMDLNGHPDLPTMTNPTDPGTTTGTSTGTTPSTDPGTNPGTNPTTTPTAIPSTTPVVTPTAIPSTTPTAIPSTTPVVTSTDGPTAPVVTSTDSPTIPTMTPPGKPNPNPSVLPGKGGNSVPPSVVDALVTKYGCVDPADQESDKRVEKKILICHIPKGHPSAAHAICIAVPGAVNGHGIDVKTCTSPVGDYCGACK